MLEKSIDHLTWQPGQRRLVLGLESSCDETGVAVVALEPDGSVSLLGQALHSQVTMHAAYGGVVPELASRDHVRRIVPLARDALAQAGCSMQDLNLIAYTRGPGLAGALLVGSGLAAALGMALRRPVLPIHHLEGHLLSPFLSADAPTFPFVALLVSGGHTQLMRVEEVGCYVLMGETIDDAAGEAFDKCAKLLGLGYPGGPALAKLAADGDAAAFSLPRPLMHSGTLDFSFAGLKTAVMTRWRQAQPLADGLTRAHLAAGTQEAIVDVLVAKSIKALRVAGMQRLVVSGGVGANARLRGRLDAAVALVGGQVHYPELSLCTDNGAMIALAAAMRLRAGLAVVSQGTGFDVAPRWPLSEAGAVGSSDQRSVGTT